MVQSDPRLKNLSNRPTNKLDPRLFTPQQRTGVRVQRQELQAQANQLKNELDKNYSKSFATVQEAKKAISSIDPQIRTLANLDSSFVDRKQKELISTIDKRIQDRKNQFKRSIERERELKDRDRDESANREQARGDGFKAEIRELERIREDLMQGKIFDSQDIITRAREVGRNEERRRRAKNRERKARRAQAKDIISQVKSGAGNVTAINYDRQGNISSIVVDGQRVSTSGLSPVKRGEIQLTAVKRAETRTQQNRLANQRAEAITQQADSLISESVARNLQGKPVFTWLTGEKGLTSSEANSIIELADQERRGDILTAEEVAQFFKTQDDIKENSKTRAVDASTLETFSRIAVNKVSQELNLKPLKTSASNAIYNQRIKKIENILEENKKRIDNINKDVQKKVFEKNELQELLNRRVTGQTISPQDSKKLDVLLALEGERLDKQRWNKIKDIVTDPVEQSQIYATNLVERYKKGETDALQRDIIRGVVDAFAFAGKTGKEAFNIVAKEFIPFILTGVQKAVEPIFEYIFQTTFQVQKQNKRLLPILKNDVKNSLNKSLNAASTGKDKVVDLSKFIKDNPKEALRLVGYGAIVGTTGTLTLTSKAVSATPKILAKRWAENPERLVAEALLVLFPTRKFINSASKIEQNLSKRLEKVLFSKPEIKDLRTQIKALESLKTKTREQSQFLSTLKALDKAQTELINSKNSLTPLVKQVTNTKTNFNTAAKASNKLQSEAQKIITLEKKTDKLIKTYNDKKKDILTPEILKGKDLNKAEEVFTSFQQNKKVAAKQLPSNPAELRKVLSDNKNIISKKAAAQLLINNKKYPSLALTAQPIPNNSNFVKVKVKKVKVTTSPVNLPKDKKELISLLKQAREKGGEEFSKLKKRIEKETGLRVVVKETPIFKEVNGRVTNEPVKKLKITKSNKAVLVNQTKLNIKILEPKEKKRVLKKGEKPKRVKIDEELTAEEKRKLNKVIKEIDLEKGTVKEVVSTLNKGGSWINNKKASSQIRKTFNKTKNNWFNKSNKGISTTKNNVKESGVNYKKDRNRAAKEYNQKVTEYNARLDTSKKGVDRNKKAVERFLNKIKEKNKNKETKVEQLNKANTPTEEKLLNTQIDNLNKELNKAQQAYNKSFQVYFQSVEQFNDLYVKLSKDLNKLYRKVSQDLKRAGTKISQDIKTAVKTLSQLQKELDTLKKLSAELSKRGVKGVALSNSKVSEYNQRFQQVNKQIQDLQSLLVELPKKPLKLNPIKPPIKIQTTVTTRRIRKTPKFRRLPIKRPSSGKRPPGKPLRKLKEKKIRVIKVPKLKNLKTSSNFRTGYEVVMKEGNSIVAKSVTPLPRNRARKLLTERLDNDIAASGEIRPKGKTKIIDLKKAAKNKKFRTKRSKGTKVLKVVEKRKFRLDTPGEKKALKVARKKTKSKKKSTKKVKKTTKKSKSKKK